MNPDKDVLLLLVTPSSVVSCMKSRDVTVLDGQLASSVKQAQWCSNCAIQSKPLSTKGQTWPLEIQILNLTKIYLDLTQLWQMSCMPWVHPAYSCCESKTMANYVQIHAGTHAKLFPGPRFIVEKILQTTPTQILWAGRQTERLSKPGF